MFQIQVGRASATVLAKETLVAGSVGIHRVAFAFSGDWTGLDITAEFKAGGAAVSLPLLGETVCTIPWEVLEKPSALLSVGLRGTRGGEIVRPTLWAGLGAVKAGTAPGTSGEAPPTDVYADILREATQAKALAQSVREDADAGEFNGADGAPGGHYTPTVTQQTGNTMTVSFAPSQPDMPAVEPVTVELPSGGAEEPALTLVNDIVVNEDVTYIYLTETDAGEQYDFDEIVIDGYVAAASAATRIVCNNREGFAYVGYLGVNTSKTTKARFFVRIVKEISGFVMYSSGVSSTSWVDQPVSLRVNRGAIWEGESISSVGIAIEGSLPIPAGTTLKVYGKPHKEVLA